MFVYTDLVWSPIFGSTYYIATNPASLTYPVHTVIYLAV